MSALQFEQLDHPPTICRTVGHIQDVLHGRVPAEHWVEASEVHAGFGLGSPDGISNMGEMVTLQGKAYCQTTEPFQLSEGGRFVSTFAFLLPAGAESSYRVRITAPLSCEEAYQAILSHAGNCAWCGWVRFATLHGISLAKSPIHNEEVYAHKEKYFFRPPKKLSNCEAFLIGVGGNGQLDAVLYRNPEDVVTVHSHVLLPEQQVLHLYSDSQLASGELEIFPIAALERES